MREKRYMISLKGLMLSTVFLFSLCATTFAGGDDTQKKDDMPTTQQLQLSTYHGKNLVLFIYAIDNRRADKGIAVMNDLYRIRNQYNFDVIGVCLDKEKAGEVKRFNREKGIAFPVYLADTDFARKLHMRGSLGFYIFNKKGRRMARKSDAFTPPHMDLAHKLAGLCKPVSENSLYSR